MVLSSVQKVEAGTGNLAGIQKTPSETLLGKPKPNWLELNLVSDYKGNMKSFFK